MGRTSYLKEQKEKHGRAVVAALPMVYPRELLTAHGVVAAEVWGPPGMPRGGSAAHLQSYVCPLAHNALALLSGEARELIDGVIVPHTCDSIQGLGALLPMLGEDSPPVLTFHHPLSGEIGSSRLLLESELRELWRRLDELFGEADPAGILRAVALHERAEGLLRRIAALSPGSGLTERGRFELMRMGEHVWVDDHIEAMERGLEGCSERAEGGPGDGDEGVPVMLSGIVPEPMEIFEAMEEAGAFVAVDDLGGLGRRLPQRLGEPAVGRGADAPAGAVDLSASAESAAKEELLADGLSKVVQRYFSLPPCPTRGGSLGERASWLVERARERRVSGAVFFVVSFCEPELFDLPIVTERLEAAGFPCLTLETGLEARLPAQVRTRVEAFVEMLT